MPDACENKPWRPTNFHEAIPALIALGTFYGFAISVTYQISYFGRQQELWALSLATLSDYLDRAIRPVVLTLALTLGFMVIWYVTVHRHIESGGKSHLIRIMIATGAAFTCAIIYCVFIAYISNSSLSMAIFYAVMAVVWFAVACIYWFVPTGAERRDWLLGAVAALPLVFSAWGGAVSAEHFVQCSHTDNVQTLDEPLVGQILLTSERGGAIRTNDKMRTFVTWDRIKWLTWSVCPSR